MLIGILKLVMLIAWPVALLYGIAFIAAMVSSARERREELNRISW